MIRSTGCRTAMYRWFLWLLLGLSPLCHPVVAATPDIPASLVPWVPWALHGVDDMGCPVLFNQTQHWCAWPGVLHLDLDENGGRFWQDWTLHGRDLVPLPGDVRAWPEAVEAGGVAAVVADHQGTPALRLNAGAHRVTGRWHWSHVPERLHLPEEVGWVAATLAGQPLGLPHRENGDLWLRPTPALSTEAVTSDRLEIQVFRRIQDGQPMLVTSQWVLDVAGREREVVLSSPLLDAARPLAFRSPLPASLEPSGPLRVQLRPGHWELELDERFPDLMTALPVPQHPAPWPSQEVWVFQANPGLRLVEPDGLPGVDPQQTALPAAWRHLPAFLAQPAQSLILKTLQRGDATPEPDRLRLHRTLWLDFDGGGFTVRDQLTGTLSHEGRLTTPGIRLGQVLLNGQAQFITRLPEAVRLAETGKDRPGVEVRRGTLDLTAISRLSPPPASPARPWVELPVGGWDRDLQMASTELHLGPGWTLLSAWGMDNLPDTWSNRWTLLDLFLVLITTIAAGRLYGWRWMGLAGLALALTWHQPGAPQMAWINLLVVNALARVLPEGRFAVWLGRYRGLSHVALWLMLIAFAINTLRVGLYPQLELGGQLADLAPVMTPPQLESPRPASLPAPPPAPGEAPMSSEEQDVAMSETPSREPPVQRALGGAGFYGLSSGKVMAPRRLPVLDPDAKVQTGPGLPTWRWRSVTLDWTGPITQDQHFSLLLLDPAGTRLWRFVQLLTLLGLAGRIFAASCNPSRPSSGSGVPAATLGSGLLVGLMVLGPVEPLLAEPAVTPEPSQTGFPSPALLDELRTRLTAPPRCLPACAQMDSLDLRVENARLTLEISVHAESNTAIPLPVDPRRWQPDAWTLDGQVQEPPIRLQSGQWWTALTAGHHQVILSGPLASPPVVLPLPLKPHRLSLHTPGWQVDGIGPEGLPGDQLLLYRSHEVSTGPQPAIAEDSPSLPLFLKITRTVKLGIDWTLDTQIVRLSPPDTGASLRLPLLPGEGVSTPGFTVADGLIEVSLPAGRTTLAWSSRLNPVSHLRLEAPRYPAPSSSTEGRTEWMEIWRLEVSPIWHTETRGLAPVHARDSERWIPTWWPFPGEYLEIDITRPVGVAGRTLTLESSQRLFKPGRQTLDTTLTLNLRSSQGGQYRLSLPPDADLQYTRINGQNQPLRWENGALMLPLAPGERRFEVAWREPRSMGFRFETPALDLGLPSTNDHIEVHLPYDRWLLWTSGPMLGPAVLYWGMLATLAGVAWGLARTRYTPLNFHQWFLLGLGFSQFGLAPALWVTLTLFALAWRARLDPATQSPQRFQGIQTGLAILILFALMALLGAVEQGLLGIPDMAVSGNGSTAFRLRWYEDTRTATLAPATLWSLPLWIYRGLMLAWALWLALAVVRWSVWAWACWSQGGYWLRIPPKTPVKNSQDPAPPHQDVPFPPT